MTQSFSMSSTLSTPNYRGDHPEITEAVTLASSGAEAELAEGTVLGRIDRALGTPGTGTNTGGGTLSGVALGDGAKVGTYTLTCIAKVAGAGTFSVVDPDGVRLADATVGVAYDGPVKFTIADGDPDFEVGDSFTIPVELPATLKHAPWDVDAVDGSQNPRCILAEAITVPASGDETSFAFAHGEFIQSGLTFDGDASAAQIAAAVREMADLGIHCK